MYNQFFSSRPTRAIINLSNLEYNLSLLREIIGDRKVMGVVKANAYGHGLVEISERLEEKGVDYLGVAYIEEAIILRESGIKTPILVLGAVIEDQIEKYIKYKIEFTGSSFEKLKKIDEVSRKSGVKAKVHIKIDTGMGRIGVQWDRVDRFIEEILKLNNISIVGIFTHLSSADSSIEYTQLQLERFEKVLVKFQNTFDTDSMLVHYANSSCVANFKDIDLKDMVRVGLLLYGYSDNEILQRRLKPVMSLESAVSYFKVLGKDSPLSYGMEYITKEQTRIVTIPVGYADGYPVDFSNKGKVYINGIVYPVRGRICMDQCIVEIGKGECYVGDNVELIGKDISLWELCKGTNQTPYTVLSGISDRVPRIYR